MNKLKQYLGVAIVGVAGALASCTTVPQGRGPIVDILITPSYYISMRAPKGLESNDLNIFIQDRKARTSRILDGQKVLAPCASKNEAPGCENLVGYSFHDGNKHYFITDSGRLTVKEGDHTVLWERGYWQEEGGAGQ